ESGCTGSAAKPPPVASAAIASKTTGRTCLTVARTVRDVTLASPRSTASQKTDRVRSHSRGSPSAATWRSNLAGCLRMHRRRDARCAVCRIPSGRTQRLELFGREPHDLVASRADLPHEVLRPARTVGLPLVPERDESQGLRVERQCVEQHPQVVASPDVVVLLAPQPHRELLALGKNPRRQALT